MTVKLETAGDLVIVSINGEYVAVLTDDEVDALSHALGCRRPRR
jgi:hypothetical protein